MYCIYFLLFYRLHRLANCVSGNGLKCQQKPMKVNTRIPLHGVNWVFETDKLLPAVFCVYDRPSNRSRRIVTRNKYRLFKRRRVKIKSHRAEHVRRHRSCMHLRTFFYFWWCVARITTSSVRDKNCLPRIFRSSKRSPVVNLFRGCTRESV